MSVNTDFQILTSLIKSNKKEQVILSYLSEEDEKLLDKNSPIIITRGNHTFNITKNQVYCYGDVDFSEDSDDLYEIDNFKFLDSIGAYGIKIPSNYNYDTHSCSSPFKYYMYKETWSPAELTRYHHGCLGKPNKIILFKRTV